MGILLGEALQGSWMPNDPIVAMVWLLRVLLPLLLLWVSFGPKLAMPWRNRRRVERSTMLAHRRQLLQTTELSAEKLEPPPCMANLLLVDEITAPSLFQAPLPPERPQKERSGKGRGRGGKDRAPRERGLPPEVAAAAVPAPEPAPAVDEEQRRDIVAAVEAAETRARVETLLNFVAFSRPQRMPQRVFCLRPGDEPPPPKRAVSPDAEVESPVDQVDRTNKEAQRILEGALKLGAKTSMVPRELFAQLETKHGQRSVASATFELMTQACVLAKDLPAASDFLMRMETDGKIPCNDLIDHVMQLYMEKRQDTLDPKSPQRSRPENSEAADDDEELPAFSVPNEFHKDKKDLPREPSPGLSAHASVFVPSFGDTAPGFYEAPLSAVQTAFTGGATSAQWAADAGWMEDSVVFDGPRVGLSLGASVFTPAASRGWNDMDTTAFNSMNLGMSQAEATGSSIGAEYVAFASEQQWAEQQEAVSEQWGPEWHEKGETSWAAEAGHSIVPQA